MSQYQPTRISAFPPVIRALLLSNLLFFLLQEIAMRTAVEGLLIALNSMALYPLNAPELGFSIFGGSGVEIPGFMPWQLITYSFLHGGFQHLFFNMFALWMFGMQLENYWGSRKFTIYYFICVVGAGLIQLVFMHGQGIPTLGASGGVFGILLAFGMLFPDQEIFLLFFPVPIKAKYFVIGYGIIELTAGIAPIQSSVAHFAHLGGMLFGFLTILFWRGKLPIKPKR